MTKHDDLKYAARALFSALEWLDKAHERLDYLYDGYDPGYPFADSPDARAWDYYDAIARARSEIINRLETWDDYVA